MRKNMKTLGIGLYGVNGHQLHWHVEEHPDPRVRLVAVAAFPVGTVADLGDRGCTFDVLPDLAALLARTDVDLVVLCSPRRADQSADAIRCLEAGKHVYAEKPCARSEAELDRILETARAHGLRFHEMAGTAFDQPWFAMRELVARGTIGDVVQVLAQKSYPYHANRPQDEDVDGGLIGQNAIHAFRFVEHVAGVRVATVKAVETSFGNPVVGGGLRMAASLIARLENGGVASVLANYLNPRGFGMHGNETVRIFGTRGFVEATDGGTRTRLVLSDRDCGPIDASGPGVSWFGAIVAEILDGAPMPLSLDDELHPTRIVIRATADARA